MNFTKLDHFMNTMSKRGFPSSELAITLDGEQIYHKCAGFADSKAERPARESDLYWIYSATKVITCIATMRLVEEGRLSLSDPVSNYIPEYKNLTVRNEDGSVAPAQNEMTVLHLFTMSGGLALRTADIESSVGVNGSTLDFVRAFVLEPLAFEPGTRYLYGLCHDVLAAICEVVTGMRFSDYLDRLIFSPLGLTDIGFRPNAEQKERFAAMYKYVIGSSTSVEIPCVYIREALKNYESGGGGLFSSVSDYLKIISVIAMGGTTKDGYRLLKSETIAEMQKNYLTEIQRSDFIRFHNYGYGWGLCGRVHMDPNVSLSLSPVGEFGWDGAAGAFSLIDPENRLAVFFATHIMSARYIYAVVHPKLRNLIYEQILPS